MLGQFKLRYPHVHNMGDAGQIMMGRFGRELLGNAQLLFLIFVMGSHVLTFAVMLDTLSDHGGCSIGFMFAGMVVCFIFTIPRTLKNVSFLSFACKTYPEQSCAH